MPIVSDLMSLLKWLSHLKQEHFLKENNLSKLQFILAKRTQNKRIKYILAQVLKISMLQQVMFLVLMVVISCHHGLHFLEPQMQRSKIALPTVAFYQESHVICSLFSTLVMRRTLWMKIRLANPWTQTKLKMKRTGNPFLQSWRKVKNLVLIVLMILTLRCTWEFSQISKVTLRSQIKAAL